MGHSYAECKEVIGKRLTVTGCGINHLVGGKVVEAWVYMDNLGAMQQLGIIPPMG
jgi:predicted ester cyclase